MKKITIALIVLILLFLWLFFWKQYFSQPIISQNITPDPLTTYTDTGYGFSIQYPKDLLTGMEFNTFYHLPNAWMSESAPGSQWTPLFRIVWVYIENTGSYPRYFDAEIRIGASSDANDVANCYKNPYDNRPPTSTTINGIPFTVFIIQDAAAMQYLEWLSYRTVHNNTCFVMEHLKTGSNYRDDHSPLDISDTVLDAYFTGMDSIVQTFKFIN